MNGYVVEHEEWLKAEIVAIRGVTYAIDACTDPSRIAVNLQEIERKAHRARKRFLTLYNQELLAGKG